MWNGKQCLFGHGELSCWCANMKHPPQVQQIVLLFKERLGIMKRNPSSAERGADVWAFPAAGLLGSQIPCCQRKQGKPACWRPHLRGIWKPLCLPASCFTGLEKKLPCSEHPRVFRAEMHHKTVCVSPAASTCHWWGAQKLDPRCVFARWLFTVMPPRQMEEQAPLRQGRSQEP